MHDKLVKEIKSLISDGEFTTQCLFQLMPTLFSQRSIDHRGNILGFDKVKEQQHRLAVSELRRPDAESAQKLRKAKR